MSPQISRSRSRLIGLEGAVETKLYSKTSRLSRQAFGYCQDFLNHRDLLFASVEIESLNQDHVETNQDPQA
jgi:hypothetical protein